MTYLQLHFKSVFGLKKKIAIVKMRRTVKEKCILEYPVVRLFFSSIGLKKEADLSSEGLSLPVLAVLLYQCSWLQEIHPTMVVDTENHLLSPTEK